MAYSARPPWRRLSSLLSRDSSRLFFAHHLVKLLLASTLLAIACKPTGPLPLLDAGMASCVTADAAALAVADLDKLRASPFLAGLSGTARSLLTEYSTDSKLLVAWNGTDLLLVERGLFKAPRPGATIVEPGLAVAGSPNRISSALAQHQTGSAGAPGLIDYGSEIGARSALWLSVRGGKSLPLGGNLSNLNVLLQDADFAGVALDLGDAATLRLSARTRAAQSAERLEERLRGFLSLAQEAEIRRPELAHLLAATRIERSGRDVTATLAASPDVLSKLLADFAR